MTTATFAFFTLFTWMVSSNALFRQCYDFDLCGHAEGTGGQNALTQFTRAAVRHKANLKWERSANQVSSLEQMFRDGVTSHYKAMTLNCNLVDSGVNRLQRLKESPYGEDGKWLLGQFLLKTKSFLATEVETQADFNDSTIWTSIVPIGFGSDGLQVEHSILTTIEQCQTVDYIHVNDPRCNWIHILQNYYLHGGLESGPPKSFMSFLSNDQVILVTFATPTDICSAQIQSKLGEPLIQKETHFSGGVSSAVHTDGVEHSHPSAITTWSDACFAAAVLLLSIYTTRVRIAPSTERPHRGSRPATLALFTLTWNCFQPLLGVQRPFSWQEIVVRISVAVCLSCALRKTARTLVVFRTSRAEMKLCCTAHQRFGTLTVTVVLVWFVCSPTLER